MSNYSKVKVCFVRDNAKTLYANSLHYATPYAAGMDLRACFDAPSILLEAGQRILVPSGIAIEPLDKEEVAGFVYSRSGLGAKHGITVAQGVGVIDSDYRGEIMIMLLNTHDKAYCIEQGERVAQLIFQPIVRPEVHICSVLEASERGSGGFGHTGR